MPSPDALSPSGLKSNSQFYSSYEGSNSRRRPSQEPIGKVVTDSFKHRVEHSHRYHIRKSVLCSDFIFLYIFTSPAEVFESV